MNRGYHQLWVVGRLNRSSTLQGAQTELNDIAARAEREHPATNKNWGVRVTSLHDHVVGSARRSLLILAAATGCLLLLACANVAGLLMSRSVTRRQEIAVRLALGAGRWQIIRQLLTESVLLAVVGGTLGLALAAWSVERLLALTTLPRADEVSLDGAVFAFAVAASVLTGVLFGLAPALSVVRESAPNASLTTRGGTAGARFGPVLVGLQVAVATVLLAGAGLLMRSFHRLQQVETGFSGEGVLTARFFLPRVTYPPARCVQLYEQMIERMTWMPGVEAAAASSSMPFSGVDANVVFEIPGRVPAPAGSPLTADFRAITPDYFRTVGIPLLSGRNFGRPDSADSQFVAIVNRSAADRFFGSKSPIGQQVRILGPKPRTIVGVIQDIRHRRLETPPQPEIYVPHTQFPTGGMFLAVRTRYENPMLLAGAVRAHLKALDPALPIPRVEALSSLLDKTLSSRRFTLLLLTVFAAAALLLAAVGTYGMLAFHVSQRTKEIGIRMAMGAEAVGVVRQTLRSGMLPVAIGLAAGTAAALSGTRVLAALLFEVRPHDPFTIAAVIALLFCAALIASLPPAIRATRVDPVVALRCD
jgi:putative ABC transport system permease protein